MSDYKIRVDVASDYSLAVEAAKINGNLDDLKLKVSSVKKVNGKNIITFSDGSQAVINDGATPTINDDGYWIINGQSTGVKGRAEHNFNELTDKQKLSIKGDKGDPLTWPDLTQSQKEEIRGPRGFTGPGSRVTNTTYDSYGNTVLTFNDGTKATIKKGDKGDKGNTGNSVSVSSVTKSGLTNTVKFSDGKSMQVKDGESVTVSSSRFLSSGDTEVTFSDGSKAVIKKGVDGTVAFDKLTESQRAELIDVLKPKRFAEIATPIVGDLPMADTVDNWEKIPTGYYFVSHKQIDGQPSNYGIMRVISRPSEMTVMWETMPAGDIFRKSGNHSTLSDWAKINGNDITVVNNLTTGGIDKALSAEQGKEINTALADLANKVASIKPGYGVGDFIQLGNLRAVVEDSSKPVKDWEFTGHTSTVKGVAVDNQGNVYSGSIDKKVMKISPSGSKIWEFTGHTKFINSIAVDRQGNVYSGSSDKKVMKISPDGAKIWEFTGHSGTIYSMSVDSQGNVYSGSYDKKVMKISPSGSKVWEFDGHAYTIVSIVVDGQGNVYSGNNMGRMIKISPSGSKVWELNKHTGSVNSIAVDRQGNVYSGSSDEKVMKISSDGSKIWEFTGYTSSVNSIAVDGQGNVYSGGDNKVKKISPSVSKVWEFTEHTDTINSVAIDIQGNVYSGSSDNKVMKIKQEGDTKITGYEVIK